MTDVTRVALIGYGMGGQAFHAPLVATTRGLALAAIVTGSAERQAKARADHPETRVVPDVETLWGLGVDAVVISTPNRTHAPLAVAALEHGLHVVVDKPFAVSSDEARGVIAAAERAKRVVTVYQNRRWDGDFRTLRRLLADGSLGTPLRLESRFERWRPTPKGDWRERADLAEAPGLLFDLGSHLIDQALVLLGPVVRVYAELEVRRPGVEADDDAFVALEHANGARSHLWMSAVAAAPAPRLRLLGSRAAYTKWGLDVQEAALRARERPGGPGWGVEPEGDWGTLGVGDDARRVPTEPGDYGAFYAGFARAVREGAPPPVDASDAVRTLEIIEAARRSAAGSVVVRLQ